MTSPITRLCLDCSSPLYGRIDKKFCDDHCRSSYNNEVKSANNGMIKSVNLILKRNRDILENLNPSKETKVSGSKLMASGFNFNYHTHRYINHKGSNCTFCYDNGYLRLPNDEYLLIKDNAT
ncbi:hypothetical protein SAMN04487898_109205 [Pedobacter sp. ok626]|uniref:hypothetical protein n=1 Tax=Pedobacter sp. ok626 TaxID=1761882 RepID=UPI00088A77B7|nr:hypothetical protein [Pedobacter sp. ok626]SDK58851.1 hypothetical protein SAMN04487898_109205 [Pedobacter sp. ok626]